MYSYAMILDFQLLLISKLLIMSRNEYSVKKRRSSEVPEHEYSAGFDLGTFISMMSYRLLDSLVV